MTAPADGTGEGMTTSYVCAKCSAPNAGTRCPACGCEQFTWTGRPVPADEALYAQGAPTAQAPGEQPADLCTVGDLRPGDVAEAAEDLYGPATGKTCVPRGYVFHLDLRGEDTALVIGHDIALRVSLTGKVRRLAAAPAAQQAPVVSPRWTVAQASEATGHARSVVAAMAKTALGWDGQTAPADAWCEVLAVAGEPRTSDWREAAKYLTEAAQQAPAPAASIAELRTALAYYGKHTEGVCTAAKWAAERRGAVASARHDACDCGLSSMIDGGPAPAHVAALVGCMGLGAVPERAQQAPATKEVDMDREVAAFRTATEQREAIRIAGDACGGCPTGQQCVSYYVTMEKPGCLLGKTCSQLVRDCVDPSRGKPVQSEGPTPGDPR